MDSQAIESMVDQMMTLIFLLCGIYCVALFFLRGNEKAMRKSKFLALGVGLIAFGAAGMLFPTGTLAALLLMILPLCLLAWFVRAQKRLAAQYWKSHGGRR